MYRMVQVYKMAIERPPSTGCSDTGQQRAGVIALKKRGLLGERRNFATIQTKAVSSGLINAVTVKIKYRFKWTVSRLIGTYQVGTGGDRRSSGPAVEFRVAHSSDRFESSASFWIRRLHVFQCSIVQSIL
jgi:hypothetical protein